MSAQPGRARRHKIDGERKYTSVRFSAELKARLDAEATRREVAAGLIVEKAVERYLPILEAQELWPD